LEGESRKRLEWARYLQKARRTKNNKIRNPDVVGAVLDLGYCLDLISSNGIEFVTTHPTLEVKEEIPECALTTSRTAAHRKISNLLILVPLPNAPSQCLGLKARALGKKNIPISFWPA
jgi:hypothetical protein